MNAQDWRKVESAIIDVAERYIEVYALGEDDVEGVIPSTETCEVARALDQELRKVGFEIREIER